VDEKILDAFLSIRGSIANALTKHSVLIKNIGPHGAYCLLTPVSPEFFDEFFEVEMQKVGEFAGMKIYTLAARKDE
jgi:hypothetical protein